MFFLESVSEGRRVLPWRSSRTAARRAPRMCS